MNLSYGNLGGVLTLAGLLAACSGDPDPVKPSPNADQGLPPISAETLGDDLYAPANVNVAWVHTFPQGFGLAPPQVLRGPDSELVVVAEVDRLDETSMKPVADPLLMRFDAESGELVWLQHVDPDARVALDTQGNIILAWPTSLRKLAPDGHQLWSKSRAAEDVEEMVNLAVDGDDNLILARIELDASPSEIGADPKGHVQLEKLDAQGRSVWSRRFGDDTTYLEALHVTVDPGQQIVLLATGLAGPFDFGGGAQFDNDVLAKYDADGNYVFSRALGAYGPTYLAYGSPLKTDASGDILMWTESTQDVDVGLGPLSCIRYFFKFDPTGAPLWNECIEAEGFAVEPDGGFVVESTLRFDEKIGQRQCNVSDKDSNGTEAMLARYDAAGNWLATECNADPSYQSLGNVALDPSGMFFMTAVFRQQLTLPDGSVAAPLGDGETALIAKVDLTK